MAPASDAGRNVALLWDAATPKGVLIIASKPCVVRFGQRFSGGELSDLRHWEARYCAALKQNCELFTPKTSDGSRVAGLFVFNGLHGFPFDMSVEWSGWNFVCGKHLEMIAEPGWRESGRREPRAVWTTVRFAFVLVFIGREFSPFNIVSCIAKLTVTLAARISRGWFV